MKVIFANRYFFPDQSATSRMISSVAFALARQGFEVTAVASRNLHNSPDVILPRSETVNGVTIERLFTPNFRRRKTIGKAIDYMFFHALALKWLLTGAASEDVAIVCTDPPMLSVTTAIALRLRGVVTINWIMDLFPETAIGLGFLSRWKALGGVAKRLRNWSLSRSAVVVCPTRSMASYLAREYLPGTSITVMHHWSDSDEIYPVDGSRNTLRHLWNLQDQFVVGYSGNFGRAHDFSTILAAANNLRHESDISFLLIGGGHQHANVVAAARDLDLPNVLFKPLQPVELLAESLSAADVHLVSLLPQLEHCIIPSKLYGIMAAGRPAVFIGDAKGEVAAVLHEHQCGSTVSIGDGQGLANVLLDLRNDHARRTQMGQAARDALFRDYSRDDAVTTWKILINRFRKPTAEAYHEMRETYDER